jgi:hypothetical protein
MQLSCSPENTEKRLNYGAAELHAEARVGQLSSGTANHVGPVYNSTNGGATWNLTHGPTKRGCQ